MVISAYFFRYIASEVPNHNLMNNAKKGEGRVRYGVTWHLKGNQTKLEINQYFFIIVNKTIKCAAN